jgi:hypothetical protein
MQSTPDRLVNTSFRIFVLNKRSEVLNNTISLGESVQAVMLHVYNGYTTRLTTWDGPIFLYVVSDSANDRVD